MYIVIFRAKVRQFDEQYSQTAQRLRDLAVTEYGCTEFCAVTEGEQEIALSYWPTLEHIKAWRQQAEHLLAQQRGKTRWYESYSVEVTKLQRGYRFPE